MTLRARALTTGGLALVLALAACGDDEQTFTDAPAGDAPGADAAVDAATTGNVTLTVRGDGAPVAGVDVVWNDPAGAVQTHETTDQNGQASEVILTGSSVTIFVTINGGISTRYITITYLDIEPGDDLVWDFGRPSAAIVTTVTVTLPGAPSGATSYRVDAGCVDTTVGDPGTPVTFEIPATCLGSDQNLDVVATAFDDNALPVGYDHARVAVTGATTAVTLDAWQTTYQPLSFTLTNPPADATGVGVETHFRIDGVGFRGPQGGGGFSGGTATIASGYWSGGIVDRLQYVIFIGRTSGSDPAGASVIMAGRTDTPATVSHDLTTLLPRILDASAAAASGHLQVSWTPDGALTATDGALLLSSWTEGSGLHEAYVMAPPGATSPLTLPTIPADLVAYRPGGAASFMTPTVIFIEADFMSGYADFREQGWRIFGDTGTEILPAGGGLLRATLGGQLPGQGR